MTAAWMWARVELRARLAGMGRARDAHGRDLRAGRGRRGRGPAHRRRRPSLRGGAHVPSAAMLANDPSYDAAERARSRHSPRCARYFRSRSPSAIQLEPSGGTGVGGFIPASAAAGTLLEGIIIKGRQANPSRPDEIVIDQNMARGPSAHRVDDDLDQQSIARRARAAPARICSRRASTPTSAQKLRVVGHREVDDNCSNWSPSGGFYAKYRASAPRLRERVRRPSGVARPTFRAFEDDVSGSSGIR